ncbi:MAG: germination protein YpeB [Tissierellia bacterium]|nr:germination protein YpeB [Tissierellia bacterium]
MRDRRHFIAPSILSILLIAALVWGYNQYQTKKQHEIALENHYQRLFFDIKKHIENIQVNLSKALVANSKERNVLLLSQIANEAISAHSKLGQMPLTHAETASTEKFLNQAADYSTYLIQRHLQGEDLTDEQRQALNNLQNNSAKFNAELANIQNSLAEGNFFLGSLTSAQTEKVKDANKNVLQTTLVQLDEQIAKTPELIYDGPFADQMINRKPVGLPNNDVSMEDARKVAVEFLGNINVREIEPFEEGENINEARLPAYTFNVYPENQNRNAPIYMGISRKGGKVVWMNNPRPVANTKLSIKNAEERALKYLQEKGFENMETNYSLKYDGTILFNFVYTENDVTIYPDLIKVKVALDTGEIVGFDASAYYMNHQDRNIETPHLDEAEARSKVRQDFNIDSTRLAIIPKGKSEVLCYEFKGKYNDNDFIVYINALDGSEEQILQIIKNENGTLTF